MSRLTRGIRKDELIAGRHNAMPDTTWEVKILGRASDLEHLSQHFTSLPLIVSKDNHDGCYLLQCDGFRTLTTSEAVLAAAEEQLSVLSGVLRLVRQSDEALRSGGIYLRHADGRRDIFLHVTEVMQSRTEFFDATLIVTDVNGEVRSATTRPTKSVALAQLGSRDPSVAKALRLLATDAKNWVGMYRLHEVIEADVGGEKAMINHGWGFPDQLKRFKHSANSPNVAGDAARHGKDIGESTGKPMSLDEAEAYIAFVLDAWLDAKGV